MRGKNFNAERAASILAEASLWTDTYAAKRWGVTARSISNWRKLTETDSDFSELFDRKKAAIDKAWGNEARAALRRMLRKLDDLVQEAGPEQIREVAGAVKIVGELEVTRGAIQSDEQPGAVQQDRQTTQTIPVVSGRLFASGAASGLVD